MIILIVDPKQAKSSFISYGLYEFEFLPWIGKLWSISNTKDSNWLRKVERKTFFTFEFLFKAGYGELIEWAVNSTYEEPVTEIYVLASSSKEIKTINEVKVYSKKDSTYLLTIERWGAFTNAVVALSDTEIKLHEIGGNDEILVSVTSPNNFYLDFNTIKALYESTIVTDKAKKRILYLLPVPKLLPFIKEVKVKGIEIEHVFDY